MPATPSIGMYGSRSTLPNLACLIIFSVLSISMPPFISYVTTHHLTELWISNWPSTDIVSFLNCLIIPNIKRLTTLVPDFPFNESSLNLLPSQRLFEIKALKVVYHPDQVGNLHLRPRCTWTGSCL
ncbi:hypothetical protein K439DRAFT_489229 [Ramaria rubella]|nr:hypothetical protein K439DRAFT_1043555 [Ramaria rubella]KAF8578286.1 hypothetical protein K439DRAFT_489229 [Ramaria rubella]